MPSVSKKQHNFMAAVANNPSFAKKTGIPQSVGEEFMKADKGRKFGSGSRPDRQGINKPKTDHGKSALFAKGGEMAESKKMMGKEIAFMKKKGAPKSMLKHEMAEMKGKKKMAFGGVSNMPARDTGGFTNLDKFSKVPSKGGISSMPASNTPTRNTSGISSMPSRTGEYTGGFGKPGGFSTGATNKLPPGSRPGASNRPGSGPTPRPDARPKPALKNGGNVKKMASGGITTAKMGSVRTAAPSRDGVASKGKTKGAMVKMSGSKPVGMKYGGKC
jgi:hypothetical protein